MIELFILLIDDHDRRGRRLILMTNRRFAGKSGANKWWRTSAGFGPGKFTGDRIESGVAICVPGDGVLLVEPGRRPAIFEDEFSLALLTSPRRVMTRKTVEVDSTNRCRRYQLLEGILRNSLGK